MRLSEDIKPISYVKANTGKVLEQVNTSGPVVITQNGEASAVLMGVKDYDNMQESLALLKILSMGSKSIEEGKGIPAETVFQRLRERIREEKERRG
ncbi:MAG: type II toxin-antitoxin system Phd/YefM family antitoxin [Desulfovibrio sp.]|jgi:prevent-host-death family protein|nr:type II toxin-antitoxin system Phd/YefM family antitoxin [Desulfovibrio sp.]